MSLLDLEHVRSALEAEKKQWYVEGTKEWEKALIENNERRDSDWYGTALVIAERISKNMREHLFFKEEDHTTHFLKEHHYDPVGHWKSVQQLMDRQKAYRHSKVSIVLPVILALVVLSVFFVLLSPPFTTWETRFLFFTGLAVIAGIAVVVGLFTGIIGGFVGLFVTGWLFDVLCDFISDMLHLSDSDIGMLYIFRVLSLFIALYCIYISDRNARENRKAGTLTRDIESERLFLSEHADQCFRALTGIIGQITDEDMREIAAIKAKKAYVQADLYGFESVSGDERETWKDSLDMIEHLIALMDYYADMSTMFPLDQ